MDSPYRTPAQIYNHDRCSKQRKHFSGAGYVRCILNPEHRGYCVWEDQYPNTPYCWIAVPDDKVRVAYPEASTSENYIGKIGTVISSFPTSNSGCGRVVFVDFKRIYQNDQWAFWGRELELIGTKNG